ncbi:hypothetical protein SAMN05421688_0710 [Poseidonocella pacifica]|uniref:Uncharacterized protein n=1 Tax=Poseidonocella pacifica TaxID=871651 RepID=A0A1I0VKS8_9RHOB|nr:hypothetical protein [Poseidonocella pacifica]SFA76623.1 hypothetical protein SAMN05421688_0710 [Poseidonocella pacifica]
MSGKTNDGELQQFLASCQHNLSAHLSSIPAFVRAFDQDNHKLVGLLSSPRHVECAKLMIQAQASLRSAIVCSRIGMSIAVNAILRQAIEYSAHAYLLRFDEKFSEAWGAVEPSSKQRDILRRWKSRFRHMLENRDPKLWKLFEGNYSDWIDFGAHPSSIALETVIQYKFEPNSRDGDMIFGILTSEEERKYAWFSFGNASLIFSDIFSYIWPDRYNLVDGSKMKANSSRYFYVWMQKHPLVEEE